MLMKVLPVEPRFVDSATVPTTASKIDVAYSREEVALSYAAVTEPDITSSERRAILRPIQP